MNNEDIKNWIALYKQYRNSYHMEDYEKKEMIRLNHLLMEATHDIHNKNMMGNL